MVSSREIKYLVLLSIPIVYDMLHPFTRTTDDQISPHFTLAWHDVHGL